MQDYGQLKICVMNRRCRYEFLELLKIEFMKVKRGKIVPLIFIAPILVVASGVANLQSYFRPNTPMPGQQCLFKVH